jgi:hypothetical protein
MRIADTLLRRSHLSDDTLAEIWYTGTHPAHLDTCTLCADRAREMGRWLDQTRDLGIAEADAAFPEERLAVQQAQILRKLEMADRPARLLSFPRHVAPVADNTLVNDHRVSSRWIAAAAAAGLVLGVIGGRMSLWTTPEADRAAAVQTAPKAPETARATDTDLLLLDSEISQPQIRSLSAIDTLTPQVNVARASDERR